MFINHTVKAVRVSRTYGTLMLVEWQPVLGAFYKCRTNAVIGPRTRNVKFIELVSADHLPPAIEF